MAVTTNDDPRYGRGTQDPGPLPPPAAPAAVEIEPGDPRHHRTAHNPAAPGSNASNSKAPAPQEAQGTVSDRAD